jgi:hypothetical protein
VFAPVFRLAVFVFTYALQVTDSDPPNAVFNAPPSGVCDKTVEKVGTAVTPRRMESGRSLTICVVALANLLWEVVAVLFQAVAGVQVGFVGTVGDSGKIADAKINSSGFITGWGWCFDLIFTDDVKFPATLHES